MSGAVGLLYDPAVLDHRTPAGHPERPERASATMAYLESSGLAADLTRLPVQPATDEQLQRVHTPEYLAAVQRIVQRGGGLLDAGDTTASAGSWRAATMAAGAAVGAVDAVMAAEVDTAAFAVVRPPGHHARPHAAMGFCILNNAAVAAAHAVAHYGLERVLLVDFDVHHGNGTEEAFYGDPLVLYFSTHQGGAYPGTGAWNGIGDGAGEGFTVNVPLPARTGDAGFLRAFDEVLIPVADRYRPQLVIASAGYDAHWRSSAYVNGIDERMTLSGFAALSERLRQIAAAHCPGRLVGILEGGYDLESLALGVAATLRVWSGNSADVEDPIGPAADEAPASNLDTLLERVRSLHGLA